MTMRLRPRLPLAISHCCLLLAVALPLPFLGAQTTNAPGSKPKVKMVPRALPGAKNPASTQSGPSTQDIQTAEGDARARVPLFRQASVKPAGNPYTPTSSTTKVVSPDVDRARIVLIRRAGTFPLPQTPASEAPVLVNESTARPAPVETVPAGLAPGKIRIIPKESIKIGTPAPTP